MGGTDCGEYRIGLGVYALGRLPGAEADALSAHLSVCASCRAELDELRAVAELLARSVQQHPEPTAPTAPAAPPAPPAAARTRRGAGRRPRTGALPNGLSGVCAYGPRGRGRSR
ncbi:MAG TPA: zf-HC2 domain-containing protein [Spirillospora sp.]